MHLVFIAVALSVGPRRDHYDATALIGWAMGHAFSLNRYFILVSRVLHHCSALTNSANFDIGAGLPCIPTMVSTSRSSRWRFS